MGSDNKHTVIKLSVYKSCKITILGLNFGACSKCYKASELGK